MATITANGDSATYRCIGSFNVMGHGTFGGGTMTLKIQNESGFSNMVDASYTSDFNDVVENHGSMVVKFTLSGATSPDIDYRIDGANVSRVG